MVKKDQILPLLESSLKTVDDMISLDELNQAVILHNLRERYHRDEIYVRRPCHSLRSILALADVCCRPTLATLS